MTDVIPDRLLASLTEAPRNCWVALDLGGMRVLECSDDLAAAIRIMKDKGLLAPLIWCPATGLPRKPSSRRNYPLGLVTK